METSKKLTWLILIFYIISVIGVGVVNVIFKIDLTSLLNYILPLAMSVVFFYFGKSGVENFQKIRNSVVGGIVNQVEQTDQTQDTQSQG